MQNNFPSIESEIDKPLNFFTKILIYCAFLLPLVISSFLFFLFEEYTLTLIVTVLFFVFLVLLSKENKRPVLNKIIVNEKGILFYNSNNELADKILYAELLPSTNTITKGNDIILRKPQLPKRYPFVAFDVFIGTKNSVICRKITFDLESADIFLQQFRNEKKVNAGLFGMAIKNETELFTHFIKGVQTFRPELKIAPEVSELITPRKQYYIVYIICFLAFLLLIFLVWEFI